MISRMKKITEAVRKRVEKMTSAGLLLVLFCSKDAVEDVKEEMEKEEEEAEGDRLNEGLSRT